MAVSSNFVIMTQEEQDWWRNREFQRGVERGKFEARAASRKVADTPTPPESNDGFVTLGACPPGLFVTREGVYGFKSEYKTLIHGFYQSDAYCLDSGEYFWGGTRDPVMREALLVRPVDFPGETP